MMDPDLSHRLARAVQVMSFEDASKLREAALKLESLPNATWKDVPDAIQELVLRAEKRGA